MSLRGMPPTPPPEWVVPEKWTNSDRRLYLRIAKRKKSEHVLGYACIAVGAQLFCALTAHRSKNNKDAGLSECADSDDVSSVEGGADVVAQESAD
jgi:hypothetical protein